MRRLLQTLLAVACLVAWPLPEVRAVQITGEVLQVTLQDAVSATGNGSTITVTGFPNTALYVTGTFVGTVAPEIRLHLDENQTTVEHG